MDNTTDGPFLLQLALVGIVVMFLMGVFAGTLSYEKNTRDCTIICPQNH